MRSTTGAHYLALDHVRALAACLVFVWHFLHSMTGTPVPFEGAPAIFPLSLFDEGHTGVALFMVLSGYLFAKLLDGRKIDYFYFLFSRAVRLLPLLIVVFAIVIGYDVGTGKESLEGYLGVLWHGLWQPVWPNGGWSIAVEMHFYLLLPLFLWLARRSPWWLLLVVVAAVLLRYALWLGWGSIQIPAYFTLIGRVDQFTLGIFAHYMARHAKGRHLLAALVALAFMLFYQWFNMRGGFARMPSFPAPPSPSRLWVAIPTIEALAYGFLIAWYDNSFDPKNEGFSRFVAQIGAYSYSIYLLHFFFVFHAAQFIHTRIMDISNFYVACAWALLCFAAMLPIGWLSFRCIENPFLRWRKRYVRDAAPR